MKHVLAACVVWGLGVLGVLGVGCSQEKSDTLVCCVTGTLREVRYRALCPSGSTPEDLAACPTDAGTGDMSPATRCARFCTGIRQCGPDSACEVSCRDHATVPVSEAAVSCAQALPMGCAVRDTGPCWDMLGL